MTITRSKLLVRALSAAFGASAVVLGGSANAAGFALIEQSASGQGNAFAGAAASAVDASTIFFNPAGMTKLNGRQLVVAGHYIDAKADFSNEGSQFAGLGLPLYGTDDDGGEQAFVPNFYYVMDLADQVKFGLGVNVPFGLATKYDDDWTGRYHALKSEVNTVNINPSLAWKMNDQWSAGFGVDIQYIDATLSNAVDFGAICFGLADQATCGGLGLTPQGADGKAELKGDDWSVGFNLGALFDATPADHIGIAYRSEVKHNLEGDATFESPAAFRAMLAAQGAPYTSLFADSPIVAGIDLPASLSLSYAHDFGDKLTLLADVTRTFWSSFEELRVVFVNPVQPDTVVDESWDDSNRYSVGMNYALSDTMTLRGGVAYDETPIPDEQHRTARIPGNDRTWLSLGMGVKVGKNATIDVGYSHLFVDDTKISNLDSSPGVYLLNGTYEADVDIFSIQATWDLN